MLQVIFLAVMSLLVVGAFVYVGLGGPLGPKEF